MTLAELKAAKDRRSFRPFVILTAGGRDVQIYSEVCATGNLSDTQRAGASGPWPGGRRSPG
jgi:hypothetical protein